MKIGYIRVSTEEQNEERQVVAMKELNVEKMFIDKVSGKNTDRPKLKEMLDFVREGDTIIVESISRFARNTKDLLEMVELLKEKNVEFVSKKEAIDTSTVAGKFMLTVFGAIAELERGYILDRQKEGIAVAKAKGKYLGRPKIEMSDKFIDNYKLWKEGKLTATEAMEKAGYKRTSWYKLAEMYEKQ